PARDVGAGDEVTLDGRRVGEDRVKRVVYAVNKPAGVVSTASDPQRRPTVVGLVGGPLRLFPVGRLDADTTGLILLTNDGELAHRLTHPSFEVDKTYRAVVSRPPVREQALRALRTGVQLDDGRTAPARVRRLAPGTLELTIHEGRKRQVRRMCEKVGHPVVSLQRVRFGPLRLGDLPIGGVRRLTEAEVSLLRRAGVGDARRPASSVRQAAAGSSAGRGKYRATGASSSAPKRGRPGSRGPDSRRASS
ncbi:MAG: rRNA pseudouridine synthase, partial [Conexibacteraceae bacterium]|nr:rRNA pseudouridine synthase [Conexibacteraceae bacterium]